MDNIFLLVFICPLLSVLAGATSDSAPAPKVALIIIDVQHCFLPPDGSLAVTDGDQVIPVINRIRRTHKSQFSSVVVSQDWHCPDHVSFASQHPGIQAFTSINLTYNDQGELCFGNTVPNSFPYAVRCDGSSSGGVVVSQTLWPDHCVQNVTSGPASSALSPSLTREPTDLLIRKGDSCGVDSYSLFYDNGGFRQTELDQLLRSRGIEAVVVTGLTLDYCVYFTSKDAHKLGYKVLTVTDASRGVAEGTTEAALQDMRDTGVDLITEVELGDALQRLTGTGKATALFPTSSLASLLLLATVVVTSASCLC